MLSEGASPGDIVAVACAEIRALCCIYTEALSLGDMGLAAGLQVVPGTESGVMTTGAERLVSPLPPGATRSTSFGLCISESLIDHIALVLPQRIVGMVH